ncbi:MAG: hypothetical protein GY719_25700 [bacterium]|nr:hypothetical protein [bacterium]
MTDKDWTDYYYAATYCAERVDREGETLPKDISPVARRRIGEFPGEFAVQILRAIERLDGGKGPARQAEVDRINQRHQLRCRLAAGIASGLGERGPRWAPETAERVAETADLLLAALEASRDQDLRQ